MLVTAAEVAPSIERHLGNPRPVALSRAALEVLAIVAYRAADLPPLETLVIFRALTSGQSVTAHGSG